MKVCPRCGFSNPDDAVYCGRCGYPLSGYTAQQGNSYGIQGSVQPGSSQVTPQPSPAHSPDTTAKSTERKALLQLSKGVNYFWGGVGFLLFMGIFVIILAGASISFLSSLQQPSPVQGNVVLPPQVVEEQAQQEVSSAGSVILGFFMFIVISIVSIYWTHKGANMMRAGLNDLRGLGYDVNISGAGVKMVYVGIALAIVLFFLFGYLGFNIGVILITLGGMVTLLSFRRIGNALGVKGTITGVIEGLVGLSIYLLMLIILILDLSFDTFLVAMFVQLLAIIVAMFGVGSITRGIQDRAGVVRVGPRRAY